MVIEMLETTDFFEERIKECKEAAAKSANKNDREFWLKMAVRWEGLLQARQPGYSHTKSDSKFRPRRLRIFAKRRRAA
jgi:hypothetical protein